MHNAALSITEDPVVSEHRGEWKESLYIQHFHHYLTSAPLVFLMLYLSISNDSSCQFLSLRTQHGTPKGVCHFPFQKLVFYRTYMHVWTLSEQFPYIPYRDMVYLYIFILFLSIIILKQWFMKVFWHPESSFSIAFFWFPFIEKRFFFLL